MEARGCPGEAWGGEDGEMQFRSHLERISTALLVPNVFVLFSYFFQFYSGKAAYI